MPEDKGAKLPVVAEAPATIKTLKFAQYYLELGNAVEAARRAGFTAPSDAALAAVGHRLLQRDDVGLYIAKHLKALLSPEEAGSILSDIARSDISVFMKFSEDGSWAWDFTTPEAQANMHLIQSIKQTRNGLEVKFWDKIQALALIAKYTRLEDPKSMQRRAVEALLAQLPPEQRARVREELTREHSPDVIEGERPVSFVEPGEDLSFLRAGTVVPDDPEEETDDE